MFRFHFYSFCHIMVTICFFSDMDTIIKSHSHWTWVISIEEKCIELWVSNKIFGGDQNCPSSSGTRWDEPMHKKGKKTTVAVQNRSFNLIWIIIIDSVLYFFIADTLFQTVEQKKILIGNSIRIQVWLYSVEFSEA